MSLNVVLLVGLSGWIVAVSGSGGGSAAGASAASVSAVASQTATAPPVPTKAEVLATLRQRFGLSAPQVPWSTSEIETIAAKAGVHPTMLQYFVRWDTPVRVDVIAQSYKQGAIPVMSWEPWAGAAKGKNQRDYALSRIYRGQFDEYLTTMAEGIRDQRYPVVIRFAHEMNGHWYPWSEQRSGNKKGDYVTAWRHIHDLFLRVGATNVIWVWSPNILRPVPNVSLENLYPGDEYVDWVGMVGYAVGERTAAEVFEPTIESIRSFTHLPILITETGTSAGTHKVPWIKDFFTWLPQHPQIVGFIWFEFDSDEGGAEDWRFTATPATAKAFRDGAGRIIWAPPLRPPDTVR